MFFLNSGSIQRVPEEENHSNTEENDGSIKGRGGTVILSELSLAFAQLQLASRTTAPGEHLFFRWSEGVVLCLKADELQHATACVPSLAFSDELRTKEMDLET